MPEAIPSRRPPHSSRHWILLVGILLLATGVRLYLLGGQGLWFDESVRTATAALPFSHLFTALAEEGLHNLPFFYLVYKPFTAQVNEVVMRFPSVIFGVLGVAVVYQLGRTLWGRKSGLIAALLLALSPFHVWFSRDATFYSLVALSALGTLYFFLRMQRSPSLTSWMGLTVFTAMGICTHYFSFAMPVVELAYITLTMRRNHRLLRPWLLSQITAFLPLTPWYIFVLQRDVFYFGTAGMAPPQPIELVYTIWNYSIGYAGNLNLVIALSLAVFWVTFALGLLSLARRKTSHSLLLVLWFFLPVTMTYLMSFRLPMYLDRYLMPTFPAFLLIVVRGITSLERRVQTIVLAALVVACSLGTARLYYDPGYEKENWRGVAEYIEQHEQPGDLMMPYLFESLIPLQAQYYHGDIPAAAVLIGPQSNDPQELGEGYERIWFILPHKHNSTHLLARCQPVEPLDPSTYGTAPEPEFEVWLAAHSDDVILREDFACITLLLFDL